MESSNCLTVIVPTHNVAHHIEAFLHSLPPHIGLIVIDSSTDATPDLIAACRPANTRLLHLPGDALEACQTGAETARSDWLLFTQATVVFAADYFLRLARLPTTGALVGPVLASTGAANAEPTGTASIVGNESILDRLRSAPSLSNLLIRRTVFHAVGGLDMALGDDACMELVWRVRRNGYPVHFAPELVVYAAADRPGRTARWATWQGLLRSVVLYRSWRAAM